MDHRAFLASLPPEVAARLTVPSDRAGLRHLAGHLGLIALTGTAIALRVPLWPLLLPLHGVFIVFLFTLEHECTHRTPFATQGLNDWIGRLAGVALVLPFDWFRYFHFAHHRHTNIPGLDPELDSAKPGTRAAWLWHVTGLPYWAGMARQLWRNAAGRAAAPWLPVRAAGRIKGEARAMLAAYALIGAAHVAWPGLVWLWAVPVLLGQPALRIYLLAEHGRCPQVADMLDNTRTTFTTRAVRFIAWNMPYHTEHHTQPAVPFHQLPALHALMRPHLRQTAPGYARFAARWLSDLS